MQYGSFLRRLGASTIDGILVGICVEPISLWVKEVYTFHQLYDTGLSDNIISGIFTLWYFFGYWIIAMPYEVLFIASAFQATPGKILFKLQVVDYNGNRVTYLRSLTRFLASFISAVSIIGYPMAAFTKRNQTLHDKMAGTLVILRPAITPVQKHIDGGPQTVDKS